MINWLRRLMWKKYAQYAISIAYHRGKETDPEAIHHVYQWQDEWLRIELRTEFNLVAFSTFYNVKVWTGDEVLVLHATSPLSPDEFHPGAWCSHLARIGLEVGLVERAKQRSKFTPV